MKIFFRLFTGILLSSLLVISCNKKDTQPTFSVDKTSITQAATAGTATISVAGRIGWRVTSSANWATVTPGTGSGNKNVTITMSANEGIGERTAHITIAPAESVSSLTAQVVKVTQAGSAAGIINFAPQSGNAGSRLTITGEFGSSPTVKINGLAATKVVLSTDGKTITCTVPAGVTPGKVTVTFGNTTLSSAVDFSLASAWVQVADGYGRSANYNRLSVGFVLNNKFYKGLGSNDVNGKDNNDFQIFDPANNTWSQGPVVSNDISPRSNSSAFVLNGKAYIGFGSNNISLADWWSYDGSGTWTQLTSYARGGSGGVAFVLNNVAYAGAPRGTRNISSFDPDANNGLGSWTPIFTQSTLATSYSSFFVIGNDAYKIGGFNGNKIKSCYRLTPATGTVTPIADFPDVIRDGAAFTLDGKGYVINSYRTYMLDPAGNGTWTDIHVNLPSAIQGVYNAQVINGVAYAFTSEGVVYKFIP